jgi:rubrerythrin
MSEQNSSLAYAVRLAAEAEQEAVEFYRNAAQNTEHPAIKRLFSGLADFEQLHYAKVVEMTLALQKKGKLLFYEGCALVIPEQSEIDMAKEAGDALEASKLSMMDVLTAAQNIEKNVGKRYTELAEQTTEPNTKAVFEKLAGEEAKHLRLLTDVYWNLNDRGVLVWPSM